MSQPKTDVDAEELRLLAEIAFTGVFYGLTMHAKDIFDYIEQNPKHREVGVLGKALAFISDGKLRDAIRLIERDVLEKNPDSLEGQLFAALALKMAGKVSHAERMSERAAQNGSETAKQFTQNLRSVSYAQNPPSY